MYFLEYSEAPCQAWSLVVKTTEAATGCVLREKVFLEILQNS